MKYPITLERVLNLTQQLSREDQTWLVAILQVRNDIDVEELNKLFHYMAVLERTKK